MSFENVSKTLDGTKNYNQIKNNSVGIETYYEKCNVISLSFGEFNIAMVM